jgi:hypothetical protein
MVYKPGESGNPTGRKKGEVNKLNIDIRQKFYKVYENMGEDEKISGDEAFIVWARGHKKVFYSLFAKLAPTNLNINDSREHESFMDRMAKEMLLKEAQVTEVKQVTTNPDNNVDNMSSLESMGNDTIITPSNGGHMGNDSVDKELNHPIIKAKSK